MDRLIQYSIFIFVCLFISCGANDDSQLGPDGNPISDKALLYLNMDDETNYILSVNMSNFQDVSEIMFTIYFDSTVFDITSVTEINDFTKINPEGPYHESNNVGFRYEFNNPLSSDGVLTTIDFDPIGNLEGTDINFREVILLDKEAQYLYSGCENSDGNINNSYNTPGVCGSQNGYSWMYNLEELNMTNICYIDEGLIIQAYTNTTDPLSDWSPTGEYVWSPHLCGY